MRIKFIAEVLLRIRNNDVNIKSSDSNNRNVNADKTSPGQGNVSCQSLLIYYWINLYFDD